MRKLLRLLVVFLAACTPAFAEGKPVNFVVILADDLGAGELACYGHPSNVTPNLDRLAKEGMRFETCWATPLCTPTRVMMMTGKYASRTGYFALMGRPLSPKEESPFYDVGQYTTFADVVKAKGYTAALAGKWQLPGEGERLVRDCGFDRYMIWAYLHNLPPGVKHTGGWQGKGEKTPSRYWHPSIMVDGKYVPTKANDYGPDLECDFLIDFVKDNKDKPFLAYFSMPLTHSPWDPTPDLDHPGQKTEKGFAPNVRYMDHLVGKLVKAVDDAGLRENTVILFTGDNGTEGDGKSQLINSGAHVPLIVRMPGTVPAGVTSKAMVSLVDVVPTIAEMSGAETPPDIDGRSFANVILGKVTTHRDMLFTPLRDGEMARDERYVLQGDGKLMDTTLGKNVEARPDDPEAKAARAKLQKLMDSIPGPRPEQQLRQKGDAAPAAE